MRYRRIAGLLSAFALLFLAPATPASAVDDFLVTSDPAPHDELDQVPGWVTLVFETAADAELARIVVMNSAGQDVTTGTLIVEGTNVTTQLMGGLQKDTYTVVYRTSDPQNDPRGGAYQFSYGPGAWTEVDDTWIGASEEPSVIASPPPAAPEPEYTPEPEETEASSDPSESSESEPESSEAETPEAETPEAELPDEQPSNAPLWFGIGGALLVAAGGVYAFERRRAGKGGGKHSA